MTVSTPVSRADLVPVSSAALGRGPANVDRYLDSASLSRHTSLPRGATWLASPGSEQQRPRNRRYGTLGSNSSSVPSSANAISSADVRIFVAPRFSSRSRLP